jgi:SAM-dependent methyltransferase
MADHEKESQTQNNDSSTSYYSQNEAYAEFLESWDDGCYEKYADALNPWRSWKSAPALQPGSDNNGITPRILDVGCGVGQVLERLNAVQNDSGRLETYGVDVSEPNIRKAAERGLDRVQVYDGKRLPFEDQYFHSVGALNVLEHVDDPEGFIQELGRVVQPGGRLLISSPNFLRVIGWRDYHPRMRGLKNKFRNFKSLISILKNQNAGVPCKFEKMEPIIKEPFTPDDDAIVATNGLQIGARMEECGFRLIDVSCADRYCPAAVDWIANSGFWKYGMLNSFVMGIRIQ